MDLLQRELYFSKDPEGGPTFSRVGGGSNQMLISIETHITWDFPGGSGPLSPSGYAHEYQPLMNRLKLHFKTIYNKRSLNSTLSVFGLFSYCDVYNGLPA